MRDNPRGGEPLRARIESETNIRRGAHLRLNDKPRDAVYRRTLTSIHSSRLAARKTRGASPLAARNFMPLRPERA